MTAPRSTDEAVDWAELRSLLRRPVGEEAAAVAPAAAPAELAWAPRPATAGLPTPHEDRLAAFVSESWAQQRPRTPAVQPEEPQAARGGPSVLVVTAVEAAGMVAILGGVWMLYEPLALIVGGVGALLCAVGLSQTAAEDARRGPRR